MSLVGIVCLLGQMTLWPSLVPGAEPAAARAQAHRWTQEARTLASAGHITQAEALLKDALALVEQAFEPDHPQVAVSLTSLADFYRTQRRLGEAEPLYQRALQIREAILGPTYPTVATSLNRLGVLYYEQGRWAEAEPLYQQALQIREAALGPMHPTVATSLNNLGLLYRDQGRWGEAETLLQRGLHLRETVLGPTHPDVAQSLTTLGLLYWDQRHWGEAEVLLQRALQLREAALGSMHPDVVTNLAILGEFYHAQGHWREAEALVQRALQIREATLGPSHPYVAWSLATLGEVYHAQGRCGEAEGLLQRALAIREATLRPEHPLVAWSLAMLGEVYRAQGRWGDAEALHQQALQIRIAALGPAHPDIVASLGYLATIRAGHDPVQAHQLYDQARRLALAVARVHADMDDEGLRGLRQSQQELLIAYLTFLATLARAPQGEPPAVSPLEEAFVVAEQYRSGAAHTALARAGARAAAADPATATLARQVQDLRNQRQAARSRWLAEAGPPAGRRDPAYLAQEYYNVRAAEDVLAEATTRLRAALPAYEALVAPEPLDLATVATLLRPDEALVSFFSLDDCLLVWLIRPGQVPVARAVPIARAALTQQVARVRASLDQHQSPALAAGRLTPVDVAGAHALYTLLLAPLRPDLTGVRHLLIVPDEVLLPLPFGALVTRDDGEAYHTLTALAQHPGALASQDLTAYAQLAWLVYDYALTTLPSATALRALRQRGRPPEPAPEPLLGFGDPVLQGHGGQRGGVMLAERGTAQGLRALQALPRLPATRQELLAVALALDADPHTALYLDAQATVPQVRILNATGRLGQARVLAFATHSLIGGERTGVAQPALVLTPPTTPRPGDDGLLNLDEILQLKLAQTSLVVLSGCNTAAADRSGEGLSGLVRAFFFAGAPAVLVSHWSVEDQATQAFMTAVFRRYARDPTLAWAEAVRQGTIALLQQAHGNTAYFAHPFAWAPFFLVGDGQPAPQTGGGEALRTGHLAAGPP